MQRIFYLLLVALLIMGCKQAKNESGKDIVTAKGIVQVNTSLTERFFYQ
mgnify:CR=1 FL=1